MSGAAVTTAFGTCPWCGETVELVIDPSGGRRQEYTEDCFVCCRPCVISVEIDAADDVALQIERE